MPHCKENSCAIWDHTVFVTGQLAEVTFAPIKAGTQYTVYHFLLVDCRYKSISSTISETLNFLDLFNISHLIRAPDRVCVF